MFALTVQNQTGDVVDARQFREGSFVLGRAQDCDIILDSTNVSRRHARVFVEDGRCYIEDLGSANGVVVDGQRVVGQRDLGTASQIQIGDHFAFVETRSQRDPLTPIAQTLFISDDTAHNKLVRINDQFAGEEFSLSEVSNTIGRTDENFILLSDPSISRNHAQVMRNGERYTLVDLGSSNGSKINSKAVRGSQDLRIGDRVHFGNVEFVFVEGETKIDPSEYAGSPGSNYVIMVGAAIVAMLVIAGAAFLYFGISRSSGGEESSVTVSSSRSDELVRKATEKLERRNFSSAVRILSDVVKHDPDHPSAKKLLARAKVEQDAADKLSAANRLIEISSFDNAISILKEIPEDTSSHERAVEQIARVKKMHAAKHVAIGDRLANSDKSSELKRSRAAYQKALEIAPDDANIKRALATVEAKMKKRRIKF